MVDSWWSVSSVKKTFYLTLFQCKSIGNNGFQVFIVRPGPAAFLCSAERPRTTISSQLISTCLYHEIVDPEDFDWTFSSRRVLELKLHDGQGTAKLPNLLVDCSLVNLLSDRFLANLQDPRSLANLPMIDFLLIYEMIVLLSIYHCLISYQFTNQSISCQFPNRLISC